MNANNFSAMDWPLLDVERLGYFGIDVGGTLCKICFYEPKKDERVRRLIDFLAKDETYGEFHCTLNLDSSPFHLSFTSSSFFIFLCCWLVE